MSSAIPMAGLGPAAEFPQQIIDDTKVRAGLRHVQLGEDGETWLFLAHAYRRDVLAAIEVINREDNLGWDTDDLPDAEALEYTYARLVPGETDEDGWHLDWTGGGEDHKANRDKPDYFPVVIWSTDS